MPSLAYFTSTLRIRLVVYGVYGFGNCENCFAFNLHPFAVVFPAGGPPSLFCLHGEIVVTALHSSVYV